LLSVAIGYFVEIKVSSNASLIVFLALFFANFVASWIAVILLMDGSLKDAQGRQAQLDIELAGRRWLEERRYPYLADWGARPVNFARRSSKNASRINGALLENACSVDLLPCR
jgi:hypothetical protein